LSIVFVLSRPAGSEAEMTAGAADRSSNPDHIGGYQVAVPIFEGVESKFGLVLPKFGSGIFTVPKPAAAPTST
jgi:solute carrier family 25 aspartate/glutamate transporter 12/13